MALLSSDGMILALVIDAFYARIRLDHIQLITRKKNGSILSTTNKPDAVSIGSFEVQVFRKDGFAQLYSKHCLRFTSDEVEPFQREIAMLQLKEICQANVDSSLERGEIYYLNSEKTIIRSTIKGAATQVIRSFRSNLKSSKRKKQRTR